MSHNKLSGMKNLFSNLTIRVENETDYMSSAVLLPLIETEAGLSLLFEVRSAQLAWQPGEVCFPGGRIEATDRTPRDAAQRETCEELGLLSADIEIFGPSDYIISPLGVILHPYVGYIASPEKIRLNKEEVAGIFSVPLHYLFSIEPRVAHMQMATRPKADFPFELLPSTYPRDWNRRITYPLYFYEYDDHVIWGLTGRVVKGFIDKCKQCGIEKTL